VLPLGFSPTVVSGFFFRTKPTLSKVWVYHCLIIELSAGNVIDFLAGAESNISFDVSTWLM
jgi:hypothetical protein